MKKIEAKIVADSISPQGHRITSMLLTYPRFIHGEIMTHRMFSRNSASSRAIPFQKMVKSVEEDPFIPIAWQKDHKGMQGSEYITDPEEIQGNIEEWMQARNFAIMQSMILSNRGVTKQLCNRLLEPFMWHTTLVTATEWDNFFELRCPKYEFYGQSEGIGLPVQYLKSKKDYCKVAGGSSDEITIDFWLGKNKSQAEIHIQALAESMWDALNESKPKHLKSGQWHIPFGDYIDEQYLAQVVTELYPNWFNNQLSFTKNIGIYKIKIATARTARLSFMTFEGEINYKKDLGLHDKLFINKHESPFEHCTRAMSDDEYYKFFKGEVKDPKSYSGNGWCNNFRGWIQYRYLIEK